jgi:hypothetical protein
MPCYDGQAETERRTAEEKIKRIKDTLNIDLDAHESELNEVHKSYCKLADRVDEITRMLCYVMGSLSEDKVKSLCGNNFNLSMWWRKHEEFDGKRRG